MYRTPISSAVLLALVVAAGMAMLLIGCASATTAPTEQATVEPIPVAAAGSPTPRPAPRRTLRLPASIDATGSTDVAAELQAFVNDAPNGSAIVFRAGGRYRLDRALWVDRKRNVTLDGNGARIDLPAADLGFGSIGFHVSNSVGTTIRDFVIVGNNSDAGTSDACCERENNHAVAVLSSDDTLIEGVDIRRVWGDCLLVRHFDTQNGDWSDGVTFRDSRCRLTGRMGVTINGGKHVLIEDSVFDDIGYAVIAIEPNLADQGASDVVVRNNTIGAYSLTDQYRGFLLYACDATWIDAPSTVRDVTLSGNTVAGNPNGKGGEMMGLNVKICGDRGNRLDFTVTDNTAARPVVGPVMLFTDVKGVTVTGNDQPLSSGELATFPGSSDVTYEANSQ